MDTTPHSQRRSAFWTLIGFGLCLLLFWIGARWLRGTTPSPEQLDNEVVRAAERIKTREQLQLDDAKLLASVEWIDKEKGIARIPIDTAKRLVAGKLAAKTVRPSTPIAGTNGAPATPTPATPGN